MYVPNGKEGSFIKKIVSYQTKNNTTITFPKQLHHVEVTQTVAQLGNNISVKRIKDVVVNGEILTKALINLPVEQEDYFVAEIQRMFPEAEFQITPSNADLVNSIEDVSIALLEGL